MVQVGDGSDGRRVEQASDAWAPTPPAWYPDPWVRRSLRWWDGNRWTGLTQRLSRDLKPRGSWGRRSRIRYGVWFAVLALLFNASIYCAGWAASTFPDSPPCPSEPWTVQPTGAVLFVVTWLSGIVLGLTGYLLYRRAAGSRGVSDRRIAVLANLGFYSALIAPMCAWVLLYGGTVANCGL